MKRNISDLMDHIQDVDIPVSCQTPLSSQRIKELTMNKIKKNKGRRLGFRVLLAAAVLIALGVTAIAADEIWGFAGEVFGEGNNIEFIQPEHVETIDDLGASFPGGITSNGATMTPIAILGDDKNFYLHLRVEAPEGVVLPNGIIYQLSGVGEGHMNLYVPENAYHDVGCTSSVDVLHDEDPTDNVKEFVLQWKVIDGYVDMKFNDGISKILTIKGLWEQVENGKYREIFTGEFTFDIGRFGLIETAKPQVTGLSAGYDDGDYSVTLQSMTVNPLGIHYVYVATRPSDPAEYPRAEFVIVLKDGTEVNTVKGLVGRNEDGVTYDSWANFYEPIDLNDIDYILFGQHKIPVEPEPVRMAPLPADASAEN